MPYSRSHVICDHILHASSEQPTKSEASSAWQFHVVWRASYYKEAGVLGENNDNKLSPLHKLAHVQSEHSMI